MEPTHNMNNNDVTTNQQLFMEKQRLLREKLIQSGLFSGRLVRTPQTTRAQTMRAQTMRAQTRTTRIIVSMQSDDLPTDTPKTFEELSREID
jgi:hypothetical protein